MAKITLNYFARNASNEGVANAAGAKPTGGQALSGAGAATAAPTGSRFVRIATDTSFVSDVYGVGTETLHPANSAEQFPVKAGQVLTFSALS